MPRGGRQPGAGRPRLPAEDRDVYLQVRCTRSQRDTWHAAATAEGTDVSEVVRDTLDEWAAKVLAK